MNGQHLAIQITDSSARFVAINNDIIVSSSNLVLQSSDDANKKQEVQSHFENTHFLKNEFDEISVAWATKRSTLVPNVIFSESSPVAIFELCYGKQTNEESIDYNRISELSVINVFEIPDWIKRFFVLKFPRVIIQHEGTHVLRKVMSESAFKTKATAILHKDYFQLTIVRHNNLEFYSFFDFQSAEDIIYHLLFTFQQKELTNQAGSIEFVLGTDADKDILDNIGDHLKKIKDLEQLEVHLPSDYISKSQLLCV